MGNFLYTYPIAVESADLRRRVRAYVSTQFLFDISQSTGQGFNCFDPPLIPPTGAGERGGGGGGGGGRGCTALGGAEET